MFGRRKPAVCAVCSQRIYRSWDEEGTEYKSHSYFGDTVDKQKVDSLLDQHHDPITKEELKAAQARVRKYSPNHPSLSEKTPSVSNPRETLPDNVISLEQFRNRKRSE